jgi:hypothetical protein
MTTSQPSPFALDTNAPLDLANHVVGEPIQQPTVDARRR